jgi:sugar phosphate isomerase/epimerase
MMSTERASICNFTLLTTPFPEQFDAIAGAGATGMGVCEGMIPEDWSSDKVRAELDAYGLRATICLPALLSPLPLVLFPGPDSVDERVAGLQESVRRLAPLQPEAMCILTGPAQELPAEEARERALDGIARVSEVARAEGVRLALEPIYSADAADWSLIDDIPGAVSLLDELADPNVGMLVDSFHLWDTPEVHAQLRAAGTRIAAVHVNDRGADHRSWADRRVPGTGVIDLVGWLQACEDAGFRGHYDVEIFSDNGAFGVGEYADSLWDLPPAELAAACVDGFERVAAQAGVRP